MPAVCYVPAVTEGVVRGGATAGVQRVCPHCPVHDPTVPAGGWRASQVLLLLHRISRRCPAGF